MWVSLHWYVDSEVLLFGNMSKTLQMHRLERKALLHCQMKEQVGAHVGDLLKPRFKSNVITKEDYKWIIRKTVDKVQFFCVCKSVLLKGVLVVLPLEGNLTTCNTFSLSALFRLFQAPAYAQTCTQIYSRLSSLANPVILQVASSSTSASGVDFLTDKRKAKIATMVEHYVSQRKLDQSATSK